MQQDGEAKNVPKLYLRSNSWWAYTKNVLVVLLCFGEAGERVLAVDVILKVRAGSEQGSTAVRLFLKLR